MEAAEATPNLKPKTHGPLNLRAQVLLPSGRDYDAWPERTARYRLHWISTSPGRAALCRWPRSEKRKSV